MTEFRTLRETLGWSIIQTAEALDRSWRYVKELDVGDKQPHPHTLALMRTWAAPWFPADRRPQPGRKDAA